MTATLNHDAVAASFTELRLRPTTMSALGSMNITDPTPIQAQALPALLAGRDVIGQARTGSGKTLAFAIPAVELVDPTQRAVQVLVLTPTRELAVQVGGVFDLVANGRGVKTVLIFGGRTPGPQIAALRQGAHIVVGTPGRVLDLLSQGALDLRNVRFLVLDEADEMLDRGFAPDVERILSRTPRERQTALFSATVPEWVSETSHKHLRNPVSVKVDPRPEDSAPIEHTAYELNGVDKQDALRDLLDNRPDGSTIVFGRTKHGVKKLERILLRDGYPVGALQGNLSQNARDRVMEDFRSGAVQILLATNVAARGLDITSVALVINVDLPESPELLTHRVGRTGRMGRKGQAITLLGPEDGAKWKQLERGLGKRIPRLPWPGALAAIDRSPAGFEPLTAAPRPAPRPAPTRPAASRNDVGPSAAPSRQPRQSRAPRQQPAQAPQSTSGFQVRDFRPSAEQVKDYFSNPVPQAPGRDQRSRFSQPASRGQYGRHQIVCSGCGQQAEVPFQPDPSRPVYCSACFTPKRTERR
ncbi:MAG: DEAD/DEAH box helicase [Thermomicrobiales bacterium]